MISNQPPSESVTSWYLRSVGDRDTHRGTMVTNGTVTATCGAVFPPRPLALGGFALRGDPPDPTQVCPVCRSGEQAR
ncbi:MAG: hypothetical protein ACRDSH_19565 [Pseudonocardiaceae bacterium]